VVINVELHIDGMQPHIARQWINRRRIVDVQGAVRAFGTSYYPAVVPVGAVEIPEMACIFG
jgi:hypothetical protein